MKYLNITIVVQQIIGRYLSTNHCDNVFARHFSLNTVLHFKSISSFVVKVLLLNSFFNILNINSTGAKSGEYFGIYNKYIFKNFATILTKSVLCANALSRKTTIRGIFSQNSPICLDINKLSIYSFLISFCLSGFSVDSLLQCLPNFLAITSFESFLLALIDL